jgi:hypothetical protein
MANENDVLSALIKAAEKLLARPLTQIERDSLISDFRVSKLPKQQRAIKALAKAARLDESQIQIRAASSDDTDRAIRDLDKVMQDWNS